MTTWCYNILNYTFHPKKGNLEVDAPSSCMLNEANATSFSTLCVQTRSWCSWGKFHFRLIKDSINLNTSPVSRANSRHCNSSMRVQLKETEPTLQ
uniref:Uncharacterized protein n=1 Tax=Manihot esculenta TaxID=3983 RepID=A0A2C9VWQ2_MANES